MNEAVTDEFKKAFRNPGTEYRGKPFWSWNGELKKEEILRQIHIMKEMGLGGYFMHSRSGLLTEYLGEEWFELINAGTDEGEALEMEAWLYDEDRWPSGSAGGKVAADEKYRMKSLQIRETDPDQFEINGQEISLFVAKMDGINVHFYHKLDDGQDVKQIINHLEKEQADTPGVWKVLAFYVVVMGCTSEHNGTTYIDTMNLEATKRFITLTHEQYAAHCGERIGTTIKGIFTDEPYRGQGMGDYKEENGIITCSIAWTEDLFEEFLLRYGYDAREVLPELFYRPKGERFAPVKHDYFDLADNLFLERFAIPIHEWCREHHMIFTGHVLHEDTLSCQAVPHGSLMRFYEHMDYPGVDVLCAKNEAYWIVKQLSSVARQMGQNWLLSELYGCSGWEFSMKGQKIMGDWQALLGINVRCQHLSWYTMEGEAKRDYPGSMLHQAAWYPYYDGVESYFARFGLFMSEGRPVCDVLVINAIESAWSQSYAGWTNWLFHVSEEVDNLQKTYEMLFHILMDHHIDFDYGEEQMMASHSYVKRDGDGIPALYVGEACYHVVVVGGLETIRPSTLQILREFMDIGGKVIFAGDPPAYVNARRSEEARQLAEKAICVPLENAALVDAVRDGSSSYITVRKEDGSAETEVFAQVRDYNGKKGVVLLNRREDVEKKVQVICKADGVQTLECWDFETGNCYNAERLLKICKDRVAIQTTLLPAGTKAFVLSEEVDSTLPLLPFDKTVQETMKMEGDFPYSLKEKNVCVLDRVRWRMGEDKWHLAADVLKADRQIRDFLGLEYRSGQMLQPWFSKEYDKKVYGTLELEYEFDAEMMPEGEVYLAAERPETMQYSVNGVRLNYNVNDGFWIDDCFKKLRIPKKTLRKGTNIISVKTEFRRITNVEAVYLVGEFGVQIEETRVRLTKLPPKLNGENLKENHLPFYTGEITYFLRPEMYQDVNAKGTRIFLVPKSKNASLYKVKTQKGETCIYWEPYEVDVSEAIANHETIEVTVVASRRNTFGPLHLLPCYRVAYGPEAFMTEGDAWTDGYALIDNGFEVDLLIKE